MKCQKRKHKGKQKLGLRVRGVARGRECCRSEMEWRKYCGSGKNGSEDIINVWKAKEVWGEKKAKIGKSKIRG